MHTVFSGNGEREDQGTATARGPVPGATAPSEEPVIHFATCNLCDSRVRGDRYVSFQSVWGPLQIVNFLYPEMP